MEMIRISDSKLKIMMSKEDLAAYDLTAEELDYSNTETKRMLWALLSQAKQTADFDADGSRVLVQLFSSRSGGCELFITRLGEVCRACSEEDRQAALCSALHCKPAHRSPAGGGRTGAFGFECMEWLLTVCHRLCGIGYAGDSEAYIGDDGRYYLFLEGLDPTGYLPLDEYSFIVEYGTAENVDALRSFLGEHGRRICEEGAVEQLGVL